MTPEEFLPFSVECMYGRLREVAESLDVPLGFAYPAVLTFAGLSVHPAVIPGIGISVGGEQVLGSLYVCLMGEPSSGKGKATERARAAVPVIPFDSENIIEANPNSDRGLARILEDLPLSADIANPDRRVLLIADEMGKVLEKGGIQGSGGGLISDLNTLYTKNRAGGADKKKIAFVKDIRLSFLANLPITSPEDFSTYFGQQTTSGLSDRFIFAVPEKPMMTEPMSIPKADIRYSNNVVMPKEFFRRVNKWKADSITTRGRRMGENLLRIALIASCANNDPEVTEQSFEAACRFMEWQAEVRKIYKPGQAKNLSGELTGIILEVLSRMHTGMNGVIEREGRPWFRLSQLIYNYRLHEKYGANSVKSTINALMATRGISYLSKERGSGVGFIGPAAYEIFGQLPKKGEEVPA